MRDKGRFLNKDSALIIFLLQIIVQNYTNQPSQSA